MPYNLLLGTVIVSSVTTGLLIHHHYQSHDPCCPSFLGLLRGGGGGGGGGYSIHSVHIFIATRSHRLVLVVHQFYFCGLFIAFVIQWLCIRTLPSWQTERNDALAQISVVSQRQIQVLGGGGGGGGGGGHGWWVWLGWVREGGTPPAPARGYGGAL